MSGNYILLPAKPVLVFEVFLPKKFGYFCALTNVLDSFLSAERAEAIPEIERIVRTAESIPGFEKEQFLADICEVISGYSIYEVDGRFRNAPNSAVDERVLVIKFIIHDPAVEGGMRPALVERSKEIIRYLITQRFAEEIGMEDEIWFVEYQHSLLQRWKKVEPGEGRED